MALLIEGRMNKDKAKGRTGKHTCAEAVDFKKVLILSLSNQQTMLTLWHCFLAK